MSSHEQLEHAEHAEHAAHSNKKVALVIDFGARIWRFPRRWESAQTTALTGITSNPRIRAFFQAKTIRQTTLRTATEAMMAGTWE